MATRKSMFDFLNVFPGIRNSNLRNKLLEQKVDIQEFDRIMQEASMLGNDPNAQRNFIQTQGMPFFQQYKEPIMRAFQESRTGQRLGEYQKIAKGRTAGIIPEEVANYATAAIYPYEETGTPRALRMTEPPQQDPISSGTWNAFINANKNYMGELPADVREYINKTVGSQVGYAPAVPTEEPLIDETKLLGETPAAQKTWWGKIKEAMGTPKQPYEEEFAPFEQFKKSQVEIPELPQQQPPAATTIGRPNQPIPTITTDEEFIALPPGTVFRDPTGKLRIKPMGRAK